MFQISTPLLPSFLFLFFDLSFRQGQVLEHSKKLSTSSLPGTLLGAVGDRREYVIIPAFEECLTKQMETQAATSKQTQIVSVGCVVSTVDSTESLMEVGPEEEGQEERWQGFCKLEAVLTSGKNRSVAF